MEAFTRCIYVHPFHEEDPVGLVKLIGTDNVLFGSDFPHPEGMYDPVSFVDQLEGLPEDDKAKIMGGKPQPHHESRGLAGVHDRLGRSVDRLLNDPFKRSTLPRCNDSHYRCTEPIGARGLL